MVFLSDFGLKKTAGATKKYEIMTIFEARLIKVIGVLRVPVYVPAQRIAQIAKSLELTMEFYKYETGLN